MRIYHVNHEPQAARPRAMREPASRRIRVLVIEDRPLARSAIRDSLSEDPAMHVIGEVPTGQQAEILALRSRPDVVVVGLHGAGTDDIVLLERLRKSSSALRVLVLTTSMDADHVIRSVGAGIDGYLLQDTSPAELTRAVRQVAEGTVPLHPQAARAVVDEFARSWRYAGRAVMRRCGLTEREIDILTLLTGGLHDHEIARGLFISIATAKTHLRSIFKKLHVHSRVQAVTIALRHGLGPSLDSDIPE